MISQYLVLGFLLVFVMHYLWVKTHDGGKLTGKIPPGPIPWPFFGNVGFMNWKNPFMTYVAVGKKYGVKEGICCFKIGMERQYVISDFKLAKEIFTNDPAFAGRKIPGDGAVDMFTTGQMHGIVNSEGEQWEELRRFTLRQLRDFGFGKASMESLIMDELTEVLGWVKSQEGRVMEGIRDKLCMAGVNALWRIFSGRRYSHDDPKLMEFTQGVTKGVEDAVAIGGLVFFWPRFKTLLPEWSGYNVMRRQIESFRENFTIAVTEHKDTYESGNQQDFIDVFLKEIKSCDDPKSAFYKDFGERNLVGVMADLIMAGTESVSVTIEWTLLYLAVFPKVQKRLQEELDLVVGKSRQCNLSDRRNLPYTQAVMAEVLRFSSIVPPGVARKSMTHRVCHGWAIPAGTALWVNIYGIHKNPEYWGDPENFRPERFLSTDGTVFQKHEALIPFSIGRRQCVGEAMARDSFFLYMTNIFHRFEVSFDPTDSKANPGFNPKPGLLLSPQQFNVIFKERI